MEQVKEAIPLLIIYKQGDQIFARQSEEKKDPFGLYGYLRCYIKKIEEELLKTFKQA